MALSASITIGAFALAFHQRLLTLAIEWHGLFDNRLEYAEKVDSRNLLELAVHSGRYQDGTECRRSDNAWMGCVRVTSIVLAKFDWSHLYLDFASTDHNACEELASNFRVLNAQNSEQRAALASQISMRLAEHLRAYLASELVRLSGRLQATESRCNASNTVRLIVKR